MNRTLSALVAALIAGPAIANNVPHEPAPSADIDVAQQQQQVQSQAQSQHQTASTSATAVSANDQSVQFRYPRQAPSTAQGGLAIGSCGAGANGGGSNTGGSAFLGLAWTPRDCKLLLAAGAYQSLGMYDSACELINGISVVRARWKELGAEPPSCEVAPPAPAAATPAVVVVPDAAAVAAVTASEHRITERMDRQAAAGLSK